MKAVVFDLDGTLIDSAPDIHDAANALMRDHGLPALSLETVTGFIGNGIAKLVERCFRHHDAPPADPAAALAQFKHHYNAGRHRLSAAYPGVEAALARLSGRGLALGVCTNKDEAPARALLAEKALDSQIAVVVGGDSTPVRKPDPAPLMACVQGLGARIDEIVYVGDSAVDAATAHAAGARFLLHLHGYRVATVDALRPAATLDHFDALDAALDAAWAAQVDAAA